jgi:DNA polymerase III gamma/tau subunit
MVSFVVISSSKEQRVTFASDFCFKKGIGRFDITIIEKDTTAKDAKQSIGIEDVKLMQKKIVLKPIRSPQKAVIIEDAHLLTTEAQNALLKVLEEPPANTILILGANTKESLLPTILSRCQLFVLEEDKKKLTNKKATSLSS